jgi:uncharacterized protein YggE
VQKLVNETWTEFAELLSEVMATTTNAPDVANLSVGIFNDAESVQFVRKQATSYTHEALKVLIPAVVRYLTLPRFEVSLLKTIVLERATQIET